MSDEVNEQRTSPWKSRSVAVIGGGGFLGGHLVEQLRQQGCEPVVPRTADGWDFRSLDSAREFFRLHKPEVVFNCAAKQGGLALQQKAPAEVFYDNMLLGLNTMHAAHLNGVAKYVNVVAACSYPGYVDGMLTEKDYWDGALHESVVNYGFTKKAQVVQGFCYRKQYGFQSIQLLMTNLFGPREHFSPGRSHGLAALLRKFYEARTFQSPEVVIWGTGKPIREWLFVKDAAEALMLAAERYAGTEPLNVSLGGGLSITELAELIQRIVGYEGRIVYDTSKPDGALVKTFGNECIKREIGWRPRTPLEEGIRQTLAWLDANYEQVLAADQHAY